MYVYRDKKEFNPINIRLETEDEAELMWHILNKGIYTSQESYWSNRHLLDKVNGWINLKQKMWEEYDIIYKEDD